MAGWLREQARPRPAAFNELGIDASSADGAGGTTEEQFREKIAKWESLPQPRTTNRLLAQLHVLHQREIADFKQRFGIGKWRTTR